MNDLLRANPNRSIVVNGRFMTQRMTGVQRVAKELYRRLSTRPKLFEPPLFASGGLTAHAWEQLVLGRQTSNKVLWSPCNTGPITHRRHVVTLHDLAALDKPEWFSPSFSALYKYLIPPLVHNAVKIVTVSDFSKERICDLLGASPEKVIVIQNGVTDDFFPEPEGHLNFDNPYYLALSTIEPRKNLQTVLTAWRKARSSLPPEARLVIAGATGPSRVFAASQIDSECPAVEDGVIFKGFVSDSELPGLIRGAIATIYMSHYEGFGLPVAESLASGVPAITSSTTALTAFKSWNALMAHPNDASMIADIIVDVYRKPSYRQTVYSQVGRFKDAFNWDRAASALEMTLMEIS